MNSFKAKGEILLKGAETEGGGLHMILLKQIFFFLNDSAFYKQEHLQVPWDFEDQCLQFFLLEAT